MEIKQSTSAINLVFFMVASTDHVTPKTGLSPLPTVMLSKNGAGFFAALGTVSEIGNGFYKVAGHATDSGTLGMLALYATASGADPCAMAYTVVANLESDSIAEIAIIPSNSASAVRMNLAAELGRMDAAVSSRLASASYTAPANPANSAVASAVRTELATELSRLDAAVSSRLAASGYTAPNNPTDAAIASAVRAALLTELSLLDAAISTRASIASTGAQIASFETA